VAASSLSCLSIGFARANKCLWVSSCIIQSAILGSYPQFNVHSGPKSNLDMAMTCAGTCGRALRRPIGWPECANFFSFGGHKAESTQLGFGD
jgi:hypothetical protein